MIIGIKIIWSANKFLPKAIYIVRVDHGQHIGDSSIQPPSESNKYKTYCYRWYPYIKF